MLIFSTSDHVKYGGCFFVTCGLSPSVSQGIAWASCNIGGSLKRAVGIAMFVMFANIAALTSAFSGGRLIAMGILYCFLPRLLVVRLRIL
jgi:hypothetical protein